MLVYLVLGKLPWKRLPAHTREEKYAKISEIKVNTAVEVLCKGLPIEFSAYLVYCKGLDFEDWPDYGYWKRVFRDLATREGEGAFD